MINSLFYLWGFLRLLFFAIDSNLPDFNISFV